MIYAFDYINTNNLDKIVLEFLKETDGIFVFPEAPHKFKEWDQNLIDISGIRKSTIISSENNNHILLPALKTIYNCGIKEKYDSELKTFDIFSNNKKVNTLITICAEILDPFKENFDLDQIDLIAHSSALAYYEIEFLSSQFELKDIYEKLKLKNQIIASASYDSSIIIGKNGNSVGQELIIQKNPRISCICYNNN